MAAPAGTGVAVAVQDGPRLATAKPRVAPEYEPTATQEVVLGQATAVRAAPGTLASAGSGARTAVQLVPRSSTSMPCRLPSRSTYEPTAVQDVAAGQATETSVASGRALASAGSGAARPDQAEPCPVTSSASRDMLAAYWPTATQAVADAHASAEILACGAAAALAGSGAVVAVQPRSCPDTSRPCCWPALR